MAQTPPVQVVLRPIGSPLTLSMSSLAVASLVQSGLDLRWIPIQQTLQAGVATLTLPVVLPLIACVLAYLARDAATGTAAAILATAWASVGIVQVATSAPGVSGAVGLMLIGAAAALGLSALTISTSKPLVGALFVMAAVRFALTGAYQLSEDGSLRVASGIVGICVLSGALYAIIAFELEDELHHAVLPTFRRNPNQIAGDGSGDGETLETVTRDAGVQGRT